MTLPNPYAPPATNVEDVTPLQASPPLWNPRVAVNFSLLFSPVFGAIVQMKNWQALGEAERALKSRNWAIGSLVLLTALNLVDVLALVKFGGGIGRPMALVLLITWYYANGKSQYRYMTEKFGAQYPKRPWGQPFLWGVAGFVGYVVAVGLAGYVLGMLMGPSHPS